MALAGIPFCTPWAVLCLLFVLLFVFPFWRCNEVLIAFLFDAFDQLSLPGETVEPAWRRIIRGDSASTGLSQLQRMKLALRSYVEIVFEFGLIYFGVACLIPRLIPSRHWSFYGGSGINSVGDAVYFSAITITTVGYGDISVIHWLSRSLAIYEIGIGFVLLYVSVVVYLKGVPTPGAS